MLIDHIFIASQNQGDEAKQLVKSGFFEGSHRVHPGQGTRNRKFYFENFFLEIIWENDSEELETELIRNIGLTERVRFEESGFSRFGLGLENTEGSNMVFRDCEFYQPVYFPEGKSFEILQNRENPDLPWTFRGPFKGQNGTYTEPLDHPNGIRELTKATFQIPEPELKSTYVNRFQGHPQVWFESAEMVSLVLEFDGGKRGRVWDFSDLDLIVRY